MFPTSYNLQVMDLLQEALSKVKSTLLSSTKLDEATSAVDDLTPPHLLEEIADELKTPSDMISTRDHLIRKLKSDKSPIVKFKVLRVIRHLCLRSMDFRRSMAQHRESCDLVREHVQFTGPPDPYKGQAPNERVRTMAKEAADAIYSSAPPASSSVPNTLASQGRLQGFGNAPFASVSSSRDAPNGGESGGLLSNAVQGLQTWSQDAMQAVGITGILSAVRKDQPGSGGKRPSGSVGGVNGGGGVWGEGMHGGGMGGTGISSGGMTGISSGGASYQQRPDASRTSPTPYSTPPPPTTSTSTSTSYTPPPTRSLVDEQALIDRICSPAGIRATPDEEELRLFVKQADAGDSDKIAALLLDKAASFSMDAKRATRALAALEALVHAGSGHRAYGAVVSRVNERLEVVVSAATDATDGAVKTAAEALMRRLGYDAGSSSSGNGGGVVASSSTAPTGLVDLLSDLHLVATAPPPPPPPPPPAPSALHHPATAPLDPFLALDATASCLPTIPPPTTTLPTPPPSSSRPKIGATPVVSSRKEDAFGFVTQLMDSNKK